MGRIKTEKWSQGDSWIALPKNTNDKIMFLTVSARNKTKDGKIKYTLNGCLTIEDNEAYVQSVIDAYIEWVKAQGRYSEIVLAARRHSDKVYMDAMKDSSQSEAFDIPGVLGIDCTTYKRSDEGVVKRNVKPVKGETKTDEHSESQEEEENETPPTPVVPQTPTPTATKVPTSGNGECTDVTEIIVALGDLIKGVSNKVDEQKVREIVASAIKDNKITLSDISDELKQYIDKYRRIEIYIPSLDLKLKVDQNQANTPNIWKIIDDYLVGNCIYLIGEAGSGKTYTAEVMASMLELPYVTINCSQYTSPTEIIGGQTIRGYVDGKMIRAWRDGMLLILDEMPKLDPNTAGLLNDALAKNTRTNTNPKINSADPTQGAIPRNPKFGVIATGNIYPNSEDTMKYVGNNKQDLSLLDRFSGSVYRIDFDLNNDAKLAEYKFIYDLLVGDMKDSARYGFRPYMMENLYTNFAVVSLRTIIAFKVSLKIELERRIAIIKGMGGNKSGVVVTGKDGSEDAKTNSEMLEKGKTLWDAIEGYLVAFPTDARNNMIARFDLNKKRIDAEVQRIAEKLAKNPKDSSVFTPAFYELIKE